MVTSAATGTYTYTLTCMSPAGSQSNSVHLMVQPVPALNITTTSLPSGQVGKAYSGALTATGGIPPYTWAVASGTLPAGLSLNASTGTISGVPATAESAAALTVRVTDTEKSAQSKDAALSLTIAAAASSGGGGGGSFDAVALIALLTLGCARALRPRLAREPLRG